MKFHFILTYPYIFNVEWVWEKINYFCVPREVWSLVLTTYLINCITQEHATGPYPEPDESSPHFSILIP